MPARAAFALLLVLAAVPLEIAAAEGMSTVIGERFPLARLCFENARDVLTGAEALTPCNAALEKEPLSDRRRAVVYANRGVIQFHSGDYEAAILDFTASLDLGVFLPSRLHVNRGLAYEILRYDALARADYRAALEISPGNETARRRLAELEKPFYERSQIPRKITAEAPSENEEDDS